MAKQSVNIGVEGNDGTGDSIRESFRKANENFTELYAVFGQGGQISFRSLSDVPDQLGAYKVPQSNAVGDEILMKSIVGGQGITVDSLQADEIKISNTGTIISTDSTPSLGGPLNAANQGIANPDISTAAVLALNVAHGTSFTLDDLVITRGYSDARYLRSAGGPGASGQVRLRTEPASANSYTFTIEAFSGGNVVATGHGFEVNSNGIAYKYNSTGTDATGLSSGTTYYLRFVTVDQVSLHPSEEEAQNNDDSTRVRISVPAGSGSGLQTMFDAAYDNVLAGNWISTEALPRESVVRRDGDTMTGALYLHDHPGAHAGATPQSPYAYSLITQNKEYVADEVMAWFDANYPGVHDSTYSVSGATYTPTTGVLVLTIGTHGFEIGNYINIATASLTFTCALDSNATQHSYPRATGSTAPGGYDPAFSTPVGITAIDATTITVNIGISSDTSVHSFVSATADCISTGEHHVKCERDVKFNIDAIAHDIKFGGNSESIRVAKLYWDGASSRLGPGETVYAVAINNKVRDILKDFILTNTTYTGVQSVTSQTTIANNGETGSGDRITELVAIINSIVGVVTYSVSGATYTPDDGEMQLTIGSHDLEIGHYVNIAPYSLTFNCTFDGGATPSSYPRSSGSTAPGGADYAYNTPVIISDVGSTTITVNVGLGNIVNYDVTSAIYTPSTGLMVLTIGVHTLEIGDHVDIATDSLTFTCTFDNNVTQSTYPRASGSAGPGGADFVYNTPVAISAVGATTITIDVGAGNITSYTPSAATYTPATGVMELTIGAHTLEVGNFVDIATDSLTFTCALDSNATNHTYPRATGSAGPGGSDFVYDTPVEITSKTATTITMNVGISSDTSAHTFVSALSNSVTNSNTHTFISATSSCVTNSNAHTFVSATADCILKAGQTDAPKIIPATNPDVLQAVSKYYVDNSSFASQQNLYVSTAGDDSMRGVPVGSEGRSHNYAYRTLSAAALKAEEIIDTAPIGIGPYIQDVTYFSGNNKSIVATSGVKNSSGYEEVKLLTDANRDFILAETVAYINQTFPEHVYLRDLCERDMGYTLDGIVLDMLDGLTANYHAINTGYRFYSSVSGQKARQTQGVQTLAANNFAKNLHNKVITNTVETTLYQTTYTQVIDTNQVVDAPGQVSVGAKWDIIIALITGPNYKDAPQLVEGSTWEITITNGGQGNTDQANPLNNDLIPGKIMRGKTSGTLGRIVKYTQGATVDTVELELLEPRGFDIAEELEFGYTVKDPEITVHIESGSYLEHYPIRVSDNVSLKGDEFRRVIIYPKPGISESPWKDLYFFRDPVFDDIAILPELNPNATNLIALNKEYIKDEVIAWFNVQFPDFHTSSENQTCERDMGYVLDGIIFDLKWGGNSKTHFNADKYFDENTTIVPGAQVETAAAYGKMKEILGAILTNTVWTSAQTVTTQVLDSTVGEAVAQTKVPTLVDFLQDVIENGLTGMPDFDDPSYGYHYLTDPTDIESTAKNNEDMDVFLMNDATILRNLTCEGHGGFMAVLDPDGACLTKSPYGQTNSSFARSLNKKAFRGGLYIDGFAGNLTTVVNSKDDNFTLNVQSLVGQGLRIKKPQVPCPFYIDGHRYQVDAVTNYDKEAGTAKILLNPTSGVSNGGFTQPMPCDITLQTSGMRSMLANDFVQLNDLGYGTICNNGAMAELVSQFTYYTEVAYFSNNGSDIRSLNGSNSYGTYGMVAAGSDPNEAPDLITTAENMIQTARVYDDGATYDHLVDSLKIFVRDVEYIPQAKSEIEIDHGGVIGRARYEVSTVQSTPIVGVQTEVTAVANGRAIDDLIQIRDILTDCSFGNKTYPHVTPSTTVTVLASGLTADEFEIDLGISAVVHTYVSGGVVSGPSRVNITNFVYDEATGIATVTCDAPHGLVAANTCDLFSIKMSCSEGVKIYPQPTDAGIFAVNTKPDADRLGFFLPPSAVEQTYVSGGTIDLATATPVGGGFSITGFVYDNTTGLITVTTASAHGYGKLDLVKIGNVTMSCQFGTKIYPDLDNSSGIFQIYDVPTVDTFIFATYKSGIVHTYVSGGDAQKVTIATSNQVVVTDFTFKNSVRDEAVYQLNLATTGQDNTTKAGLLDVLTDGQKVIIRNNLNFHVSGVDKLITKPFTALTFDENVDITYRTINYGVTDSLGTALPATDRVVTFDSTYRYIKLIIDNGNAALNTFAGSGTTMGATAGDVVLAVGLVSNESDVARLNAGDMIFAWDGKTHIVNNYIERTGYATVSISDLQDSDLNVPPTSAGIVSTVVNTVTIVTLRCGLQKTEGGNITINISTCRATGHDFLDIGTGSFNTTNFPNVTLGPAAQTADQEKEVVERDKGRVFYVSTDQDGMFRVGRFFTVDQGTGTVTFSASIALSNLDGLGFKRGVVASEFSADDGMTDNASDSVPTEAAVRGYVNRRLGFNHAGVGVNNQIGPGTLARSGVLAFTGDQNAGGTYTVANLRDPSGNQDAATKSYVDSLIAAGDTIQEMLDVETNTIAADQIIVTTGKYRIYTEPAAGGNFQVNDNITGSGTSATGTVVDVENVSINSVAHNLLTYTKTSGNNFSIADIVDTGGGVTAQLKLGPLDEYALAVEDPATDVTLHVERTQTGATVEFRLVADRIVNADVKSDAAIAQSKLDLNAATTRANATAITQADLGVASFDSANFTATDGWIEITTGSVNYDKIINIADKTALANNSGVSGPVTEVTFADIVTESGIIDTTTTGEADKIVKTDGSGNVASQGIKVDTYLIIDTTGTTVNLSTPGGAIFMSSVGASNPTVSMAGSLNIGNTGVTEGSFQANSALAGESRLAVDWIHSSFIEAPGELDAASTGISIGANTGFSAAGEIALVADGAKVVIATGTGFEPALDDTYIIGSATKRYNTIYSTIFNGTATQAQYADLAENYTADAVYEPGTVVVFGGDEEVTVTKVRGDNRVAGIVSENPAYLMNSNQEGNNVTAIALQGRIKVKVIGMVRKGQMLVTSSTEGFASASTNPEIGTVIGKALEDKNSGDEGIIEVVVGRV